jgi:hypothetical protein
MFKNNKTLLRRLLFGAAKRPLAMISSALLAL